MANGAELSFKEMCARFDVTPRTLRYYEYIELLSPRKVGRARYYGAREVARMTLILEGRSFGFGLEEIRQWLEIYGQHGTRVQLADFIDRADRQLQELDRQMQALAASRGKLETRRAEAVAIMEQSAAASSRGTG